jgi:hypothetical protein
MTRAGGMCEYGIACEEEMREEEVFSYKKPVRWPVQIAWVANFSY